MPLARVSDYARQRGVSPVAIHHAIDTGLIRRRTTGWKPGRGGGRCWIDPRQADDAWLRRRQDREAAAARRAELNERGQRAELVHILAKTTMVRIEVRKLQARLVDRRKSEEEIGSVIAELYRLLGQAASERDEVHRRIVTAIRNDLGDLIGQALSIAQL